MMRCKRDGFVGCLCADCVYNENYCVNTPQPCIMADCDLCETVGHCDEIFCHFCSGHLTIDKVNAIIEEKKAR